MLTATLRKVSLFSCQLIVTLLLLAGFFSFPARAELVPPIMGGSSGMGWCSQNRTASESPASTRTQGMAACVDWRFGGCTGSVTTIKDWELYNPSQPNGWWSSRHKCNQTYSWEGNIYFLPDQAPEPYCPTSHPYESGGWCSDIPPECEDMDSMTESCCSASAEGYCAAHGGSVVSWELTGMGFQYCDYSCDFDNPEDPIEAPPPENEEECEQAAVDMCADRGGSYNYFWDAEYSSCAYSCNDNPEEIEQPPETDPANEPECTLENGVYTGQCVDDDNPDNGNCTQRKDENGDPIEGEFEGQCVVGDEVSDSSRLDLANRHLLGISGGVKGINNRLDSLPEKMGDAFGLGEFEEMQSAVDGAYMKTAVRNQEETDRVGKWFRGLFGLGEQTGTELIPTDSVDLSGESGDFNNLISAPASCPAPVTIEMMGKSYQIPFDDFCDAFITLKPFFLAGCFLMAGFIVFGSRPS